MGVFLRSLPSLLLVVFFTGCTPLREPVRHELHPAVGGQSPSACVFGGRADLIISAYSGITSKDPLFRTAGGQTIRRVSPPRRYGRPVAAIFESPIVGKTWSGSTALFSLSAPLAVPNLPLFIRPHRYLPLIKQVGAGHVLLRVDLGEASTPRTLTVRASCDKLTLGAFYAVPQIRANSQSKRWARFTRGRHPAPIALHKKPGGAKSITLGLTGAEIVSERDGWFEIAGEEGPVAYAGWVKAGAAVAVRRMTMGLPLGGLGPRQSFDELKWRVTEKPLQLRTRANATAPIAATLAAGVEVRVLASKGDFLRIAVKSVKRAHTGGNESDNIGFFVPTSAFAAAVAGWKGEVDGPVKRRSVTFPPAICADGKKRVFHSRRCTSYRWRKDAHCYGSAKEATAAGFEPHRKCIKPTSRNPVHGSHF